MAKRRVVAKLVYDCGEIFKEWYIHERVEGRWVPRKDCGPFRSEPEALKHLDKIKGKPKAPAIGQRMPKGVVRNGDSLMIDTTGDEE